MGAVQPLRSRATRSAPQPGAAPRALRLGVVHQGRIVEEHLLASERTVSVGAHPRSTVLLPGLDQTERVALFVTWRGQLHLCLHPGARGKVTRDGIVRTLDALALEPSTVRRGKELLVPLDPEARGKIQIRDYTLLFQQVEAPPVPARAATRTSWSWSDVDWIYMALIGLSALAHVAVVAWIEAQPPPTRAELRQWGHDFVTLRLAAPAEVAPPSPPDQDAPEGSAEPSSEAAPAPSPPAASQSPGPTPAPSDPFEGTFLALIGSATDDPNSALRDLMDDPSGFRDIAEALANGRVVVPTERARPQLRGPSTIGDDAATIGPLGPVGACATCPPAPTARPEREPIRTPSLTEEPPAIPRPDSEFDIRPWLKRAHPRFRACYERQLKTEPDLAGRVSMSFATDGSGAVIDAAIGHNATGNAALAGCLQKELMRMSLPAAAAHLEIEEYALVFAPQ